MQVRAGVGWQYALADLSLILFMVCAAALARAPVAVAPRPVRAVPSAPVPALADPVAVWREGAGAPSLAEWIAAQPADPRQRLTLVAQYRAGGGGAEAAFRHAESALQGLRNGTAPQRILVEPGPADSLIATLTWDTGNPPPAAGLARTLQ